MEPEKRQQVCVQVRREFVSMQWERGSSSLFELRVNLGAMSDVTGDGERNDGHYENKESWRADDAVSQVPDGEVLSRVRLTK